MIQGFSHGSIKQLSHIETGIKDGADCEIYVTDPEDNGTKDWQKGNILTIMMDTKTNDKIVYITDDDGCCWQKSLTSMDLIIMNECEDYKNGNADIFKQEQRGCKRIIKQCQCTKRIIKALQYYDTLDVENNENDKDKLINFSENIYKGLLNDFIHFIEYHNDSIQLEQVSNILQKAYNFKTCDVTKCGKAIRHNRDKTHDEQKYNGKEDETFVFYRDLFDQIHCYLYHLFDIGLRIKQSNLYNDCPVDIHQIIKQKVMGTKCFDNGRYSINKFGLNGDNQQQGMYIMYCNLCARMQYNTYYK